MRSRFDVGDSDDCSAVAFIHTYYKQAFHSWMLHGVSYLVTTGVRAWPFLAFLPLAAISGVSAIGGHF
jgi:hypothetical protein